MFFSERKYSASEQYGEHWIIQTNKIEIKHGNMIYVWVRGTTEGQQGKERQEGRESYWKTFWQRICNICKWVGIALQFSMCQFSWKRKAGNYFRWVSLNLVLSRSNTISIQWSHCCSPLLQYFILRHKNTLHVPHTTVWSTDLCKFTCNKTLTQVEGRDKRNYNWLWGKLISEPEISLACFRKKRCLRQKPQVNLQCSQNTVHFTKCGLSAVCSYFYNLLGVNSPDILFTTLHHSIWAEWGHISIFFIAIKWK